MIKPVLGVLLTGIKELHASEIFLSDLQSFHIYF